MEPVIFESDEEVYTIYSEVSGLYFRDALQQEKGYTFSACEVGICSK